MNAPPRELLDTLAEMMEAGMTPADVLGAIDDDEFDDDDDDEFIPDFPRPAPQPKGKNRRQG